MAGTRRLQAGFMELRGRTPTSGLARPLLERDGSPGRRGRRGEGGGDDQARWRRNKKWRAINEKHPSKEGSGAQKREVTFYTVV